MVEQTCRDRLGARIPKEMIPMYAELLSNGYKPSEIARDGIRNKYSEMKKQEQAAAV